MDLLPNYIADISFLILKNSSFSSQLILRHDFIVNHRIMIIINTSNENINSRVKLFSEIASTNIIDTSTNKSDNLSSKINTDFNKDVEYQLISMIKEIENCDISLIEDD